MKGSAAKSSAQLAQLRSLIEQRFPGASVLDAPQYGVLPSGLGPLDELLPGGFPRGALSLLSGGPSCGKSAVAMAVAACSSARSLQVAWLHQGSLSASSASHAGVDLERLLAVRVDSFAQQGRCADLLLRWQGFDLVVVDWPGRGGRGADWTRLHRLVTGSQTALVLLTPPLPEGDPLRYCASVQLSLSRTPSGSSVKLDKSRYGRAGEGILLESDPGTFGLSSDLPGLGQHWHDQLD